MLSTQIAKDLRASGLMWKPKLFDFFHIPDRDLDDQQFVIADLSVDIQRLADGMAAITFNGAVEWSLDYILTHDVVWVPTEAQLRDLLGKRLVSLENADGGYRVTITTTGGPRSFTATTAEDAYGSAILWRLQSND